MCGQRAFLGADGQGVEGRTGTWKTSQSFSLEQPQAAWLCATSGDGADSSRSIEASAGLPGVKVKVFPCPMIVQQQPKFTLDAAQVFNLHVSVLVRIAYVVSFLEEVKINVLHGW